MIGTQELSREEPRLQGLVQRCLCHNSPLHLHAPATRKRFLEVTVANMLIESRYVMLSGCIVSPSNSDSCSSVDDKIPLSPLSSSSIVGRAYSVWLFYSPVARAHLWTEASIPPISLFLFAIHESQVTIMVEVLLSCTLHASRKKGGSGFLLVW